MDMSPKEFREPVPWEAREEETVLSKLAVDGPPLPNVRKCVNNLVAPGWKNVQAFHGLNQQTDTTFQQNSLAA
jgi:hypothetical protein